MNAPKRNRGNRDRTSDTLESRGTDANVAVAAELLKHVSVSKETYQLLKEPSLSCAWTLNAMAIGTKLSQQQIPRQETADQQTKREYQAEYAKAARNSFQRLCKKGLTSHDRLLEQVGQAIWFSLPIKHFQQQGRELCYGSGMTARKLDYLPKTLESLAKKIDKLNAYPLLNPVIWLPRPSDSQYIGDLPTMLRVYGEFLSDRSAQTRQQIAALKQQTDFDRAAVLDLANLVREETGKDRFKDLSNLLVATANFVGADFSAKFSPENLKKIVRRIRKPKPTTRSKASHQRK